MNGSKKKYLRVSIVIVIYLADHPLATTADNKPNRWEFKGHEFNCSD